MKNVLPVLLVCLSLVIPGCLPTVDITKSWKNPEELNNKKSHQSVFIMALTEDVKAKEKIESNLAKAARKKGYTALTSTDIPGARQDQGPDSNYAAILKKIKETGSTAVFTIALLDTGYESRHVAGTGSYAPAIDSYIGSFRGYYRKTGPVVSSPGYYVEDKVYYLESNLYDVATERMIWSAQSETYKPDNLTSFSKNFTKAMVLQLEKDGILQK